VEGCGLTVVYYQLCLENIQSTHTDTWVTSDMCGESDWEGRVDDGA